MIWIVGLILFSLAESIMQLYICRIITTVGVAVVSVMVIAPRQDYPQAASRGKWLCVAMRLAGIGYYG